ncbi:nucleotidyl transferase AbiEii/AbiGii toxin family protein [Sphingobacterium sp. 2149]|uniref:nucleotidyl transferase AbiEii/AbiGii toxin family protein n=1 Tax=Sphingobacterium sp. 2149 TaxID=2817763 RepID=UPI001B5DB080|nr:nucleotidyl transferase AbiEii/AbiGii toxin family protein [Sphingobacterium sp. 2149]MDR6734952.1 putative nucleotidyltransferase component of viral defense system [Sphingobacterium sp. 2149]
MSKKEEYAEQVRLLIRLLPIIDKEDCFALKGGTAINLFYRDLPRLSVDIDLLYLPMEDRDASLENIRAALARITDSIKKSIAGAQVQNTTLQQDNSLRIIVSLNDVRVKIELSPVIRGSLFPAVRMEVRPQVEKEFGYAEMLVASHPDLYAGKLCAALDRQHPRDLFDVKQLYENEGLTEELRKTFLVFLISHFRPMAELLNPNRKDISGIYEMEFAQMAEIEVSLEELLSVREKLIADINKEMTDSERKFLLSVKNKTPDWALLGLEAALVSELPSVKWRLINLNKMSENKHVTAYKNLEAVLYP